MDMNKHQTPRLDTIFLYGKPPVVSEPPEITYYYADRNPSLRFPFDMWKHIENGTFTSGGKSSGKTNLNKVLVDKMIKFPPFTYEDRRYNKIVVKLFDISQAWSLRASPIPIYQEITYDGDFGECVNSMNESCVYDISQLDSPDLIRLFISSIISEDLRYVMNNRLPYWYTYVLEEAQFLVPSGTLSGKSNHIGSAEMFKMITVGRNFGMTHGLLCQFPSTVDTNAIKACGQAYFGYAWEANDIRKVKNLLGWKKKDVEKQLPALYKGQFVYQKIGGGRVQEIIRTPKFEGSLPKKWNGQGKVEYLDETSRGSRLWDRLRGRL